jgi:hypothetical protein
MDVAQVLLEFLDRIPDAVRAGVGELDAAGLRRAPGDGNPVGWLGWHLTRVLDDHVAEAFDVRQVWVRDGWAPRFGLPAGAMDTGYGHTRAQVEALAPEGAAVVVEYLVATHAQARSVVAKVDAAELERVVDRSYDPPVTLGVRLVSVVEDCLQHAGQMAYVRGLLESS